MPTGITMEIPHQLRQLNTRPGNRWNNADVERMRHWWLQKSQMRIVWFYASRYLGAGASREDIEDAVIEFFDKLEEACRHYSPGGPDFTTFLLHVCYKNHCVRKGESIRRLLAREITEAEMVCFEIRDESSSGDPERMAQG